MAIKKDHRNYRLRLVSTGMDKIITSHSRTIFWQRTRSSVANLKSFKAFLKVSYGMKENHKGIMEEFTNEGTYTDKDQLFQAMEAFMDEV